PPLREDLEERGHVVLLALVRERLAEVEVDELERRDRALLEERRQLGLDDVRALVKRFDRGRPAPRDDPDVLAEHAELDEDLEVASLLLLAIHQDERSSGL